MITLAYVFKPRGSQVDRVRRAVEELRKEGLEGLTISRVYEYAVDSLLVWYGNEPETLAQELRGYLRARDEGDSR